MPYPVNSSSANPIQSTTTAAPSQSSSSISTNKSCSSCAIAVDAGGLNQIFWFSETWSVTLDTEYVTVTSFNGSNATAVSNTRTVLGNLSTLSENTYVESLMLKLDGFDLYFNGAPTYVRGTDGNVGTTSFPYGQAFAQVTAINFRSMTPITGCPLNMGIPQSYFLGCQCLMNTWYPADNLVSGVTNSKVLLNQTFYTPLASSVVNENNAGMRHEADGLSPWDGEHFKSWLADDAAFTSAYPNWEDCVFWNTGKASGVPRRADPVKFLIIIRTNSCWSSCCKASGRCIDCNHRQYYSPSSSASTVFHASACSHTCT